MEGTQSSRLVSQGGTEAHVVFEAPEEVGEFDTGAGEGTDAAGAPFAWTSSRTHTRCD